MKKVDFILTADWHLREDTPVCRTDDFWETQWKKVEFISELQKIHDCPVIHSGDLFHVWKPSLYLLSKTIECIPDRFYTVYGNHDLPQHNLELANKSGTYLLSTANKVQILSGAHWKQDLTTPCLSVQIDKNTERKVGVWHIMTYGKDLPYPGCTAMNAKTILKKYTKFDLIVTGDNHQTFVEEYKGRLLVNPGSIMRQNAGQLNFYPSVFLYNARRNEIEQVFLPISKKSISREHITVQEKRNERIDAFISGLNTNWDTDVSFQANLQRFFEKNRTRKNIKELVFKFVAK